jgi:nucleoside-diphosphate-sugar epimerase
MKKALITGITGQDGSYLADLLIKKGYKKTSQHLSAFDCIYSPQRDQPSPSATAINSVASVQVLCKPEKHAA